MLKTLLDCTFNLLMDVLLIQDISPGFESQVAVTPTLYETSEEARTRFLPEERGCYFEGELPLKYLESGIYR